KRGPKTLVAVPFAIVLTEPPELRNEHLEPQLERAREAGRAFTRDLVAGVAKRICRALQCCSPRLRGPDSTQRSRISDNDNLDGRNQRSAGARYRNPPRVAWIAGRHGGETQPDIAHRSRDRPLDGQQLRGD